MGEMLILHDRLYPYVTSFPDISEYKIKSYPEIPHEEILAEPSGIVDIEKLVSMIKMGTFPIPFKSKIPAIVQIEDGANINNRGNVNAKN